MPDWSLERLEPVLLLCFVPWALLKESLWCIMPLGTPPCPSACLLQCLGGTSSKWMQAGLRVSKHYLALQQDDGGYLVLFSVVLLLWLIGVNVTAPEAQWNKQQCTITRGTCSTVIFWVLFLWCAFGSPHNQIIKMFKKLFEKFIVCIKLLLSEVKGYEWEMNVTWIESLWLWRLHY